MASNEVSEMTDKIYIPFNDIVKNLAVAEKEIITSRKNIQANIKRLARDSYWDKHVPERFRNEIESTIILFSSSIDELKEIRSEVKNEVQQNHVNRLRSIYTESDKRYRTLGLEWNNNYDGDYNNANFAIVESIYGEAKGGIHTLMTLSNQAESLLDYVGRQGQATNRYSNIKAFGAWLVPVLLALFVIFFGDNIWERYGWGSTKNNSDKNANIDSTNDDKSAEENSQHALSEIKKELRVVMFSHLPFLEAVPILDKGLFLKYSYNDLLLGGVNIDTISINARSITGERLDINLTDRGIEIDIRKEPFIELGYKEAVYSLDVRKSQEAYRVIITKNVTPTMKLKKYKQLKGAITSVDS